MTDAGVYALIAATALAVLDWIAVAWKLKPLEYVCKPAVMVALIVVATSIVGAPDSQRWTFVIALALSMLGDIFLMLPNDRFIPGVAAFAGAHLAYVVGFRIDETSTLSLIVGAVFVTAVAALLGRRIILSVREKEPSFVTPVSAYIAIISIMVASAIATRNTVAIAGAIIFMASDSLIAWNRFVQQLKWAPVTIMVTYHVGQTLIVLSLVRVGIAQ